MANGAAALQGTSLQEYVVAVLHTHVADLERKGQLPKKYTAIRLSAYIYNTMEEIERTATIVKEIFS